MSDPRHALLREIYGLLVNDPGLDAILAGAKVVDGIPHAAPHPFLALGEVTSRAIDGDEPATMEHRVEVFVHSRAAGQREASDIAERVRVLLEGSEVHPAGHTAVSIRHRDTMVGATRNGRAYRARLRFRAVTAAS